MAKTQRMTRTSPVGRGKEAGFPPVLLGQGGGAQAKARIENFYGAVGDMFEAWVARSENAHTQRAYRRDVMSFVEFLGLPWPEGAWGLLKVSVKDVRAWRSRMVKDSFSPMTLNRRLSSLGGFYQFLREVAAEGRLPIMVQNPAHRDFIKRPSAEPVDETKALSPGNARKLMELPRGDGVLEVRDRAILKFYLFTGARIATGCRLHVQDLHLEEEDATIRIQEKGRGTAKRTIGIHPELAEALEEYLQVAEIGSGPLFRARRAPRSDELGAKAIAPSSMYRLLLGYLEQLPRAKKNVEMTDGSVEKRVIYT